MDLGLDRKVVLVAGASRGIGRAIALAFAREGACVSGVARGAADLETLQDALYKTSERPHLTTAADTSTAEGADRAVRETSGHFGKIDCVIANVGKSFARHAKDMTDDDLQQSLDVNLIASARVVQRAVPRMTAGGSIVMISSVYGREAGGAPGYNVAKAAVIALAKAMARDYAAAGIRVNSVAPGSILFPGGGWDRKQQADPAGIAAFVERDIPMGRFGTAEEVADVVAFVASPRAGWVTGACIAVDGGQSRAF